MVGSVVNWVVAILAAVLFTALAVLSLFLEDTKRSLLSGEHPFRGDLHLTLAEPGGTPQLYTFDTARGTLVPDKKITPYTDITKRTARDGELVAVATAYDSAAMTIDVLDTITGTFSLASQNDLKYKREPAWSADGGKLVYMAASDAGGDTGNPEYWSVYLTDVLGDDRFIDRGSSPLLSPDGSVLMYLRDDGLYVRPLAAATSTLVWPVEHARADMKLALSRDGKRLAWSNRAGEGGRGELALFSLVWTPFSMRYAGEFELPATFTAFSPSGNELAAVVPEYPFSPLPTEPQVVFIDLLSGSIEPAVNLSGFDRENAWLTEWSSLI